MMGHPRQQLNGPDGLLLAVIDQAVRDFKQGGAAAKSAQIYFNSSTYQHHLSLLGLPSDMLPTALKGKINMQNEYEYASLSINEKAKPGPAGQQPAQNAGEWVEVGLVINAKPAASQQQNDNDGGEWEYVGLVANEKAKPAAKPEPAGPVPGNPHKQRRLITNGVTGYAGNGAK